MKADLFAIDVERLRAAATRADLARLAEDPAAAPRVLAAVGMALLVIGCAKGGETFLESRDLLRALVPRAEKDLFENWDDRRGLA